MAAREQQRDRAPTNHAGASGDEDLHGSGHAAAGILNMPGLYLPASARNEIDSRFQPLIATTASVRSTNSFSVKCALVAAYTSSGTWPSAIRVTASVQARAARSRSL